MEAGDPGKNKDEVPKRLMTANDIKEAARFLRTNIAEAIEAGPRIEQLPSSGMSFEELLRMHANRVFLGNDEAMHYLRWFFSYRISTLDRVNGGHTKKKHIDGRNRQLWDRIAHHQHRKTTASTKFNGERVAELAILSALADNCQKILTELNNWIGRRSTATNEFRSRQNDLMRNFATWERNNVERLAPERSRALMTLERESGAFWNESQQKFFLQIRCDMRDVNIGFGYVGLRDKVNIRRTLSQVRVQLSIQNNHAEIMTAYPDDPMMSSWENTTSDSILGKFGTLHNPIIMLLPVYYDMENYWANLERVAAAEGKGVVWTGWETIRLGAEAKQALQEKQRETETKTADLPSTATANINVVPGTSKGVEAVPDAVKPIPTQGCVEGQTATEFVKTEASNTVPVQASPNVVMESQHENIAKPPAVAPQEIQGVTAIVGKEGQKENIATPPVKVDDQAPKVVTATAGQISDLEGKSKAVKKAEDLIESIVSEAANTNMKLLHLAANDFAARLNCPHNVIGETTGMMGPQEAPAPALSHAPPTNPQYGNLSGPFAGNSQATPNAGSPGWNQGQIFTSSAGNNPVDHRPRHHHLRGSGNRLASPQQAGQHQRGRAGYTHGRSAPPQRWGSVQNVNTPGVMEYRLRTVDGQPDRNRLNLSYDNADMRINVQQQGGLLSPELIYAAQGFQAMSLQGNVGQHFHQQHQPPVASHAPQGGFLSGMQQPMALNWNPPRRQRSYSQSHQLEATAPPNQPWYQASRHSSTHHLPQGPASYHSPPPPMWQQNNFGPFASTPITPAPGDQHNPFGSPVDEPANSSQWSLNEPSIQFGSPTSDLASPVYSNESVDQYASPPSWNQGSGPSTPASNVGNPDNSGASGSFNRSRGAPWNRSYPRN